jgi:hypothetical protein
MESLSDYFERRWNKISTQVKTAFFSAWIVGFVAHVTFLTNRFYNHDSLLAISVDTHSTFALEQGKWFNLPAGLLMGGNIYSSAIILVVGILILALTAALTISILKIQSKLWSAIIGSFLVLFPSVMCTNTYLSTTNFFFALLLATLAVYFTVKVRHGFWLGIVFLTFSCGTYSVYIGYAAGLFVMLEIIALLNGKQSVKEILLAGLKYIVVLLVSVFLYYVILQIALKIANVSLMSYRNIDQIGQFSLASLFHATTESYRKVLYFFIYGIHLYRTSFFIEPMFRVMNWATLFLAAGASIVLGIRNGILKSLPRIALTAVLAFVFPLAIHAIGILGQNAYTHWIMIYPFVLVYVYMLMCMDQIEQMVREPQREIPLKKFTQRSVRISAVAVLIVSLLLIRQWFFTTNQGYEFLRYANENAYAAGILLVDDMRETDGYTADTPVVLAGSGAPEAFQYTTGDFKQITGESGVGYTGINIAIVDNTRLSYLLRNWVGVSITYADDETSVRISASPEVAAMPIYPAAGSIAMMDGCLVVKLSAVEAVTTEASNPD